MLSLAQPDPPLINSERTETAGVGTRARPWEQNQPPGPQAPR